MPSSLWTPMLPSEQVVDDSEVDEGVVVVLHVHCVQVQHLVNLFHVLISPCKTHVPIVHSVRQQRVVVRLSDPADEDLGDHLLDAVRDVDIRGLHAQPVGFAEGVGINLTQQGRVVVDAGVRGTVEPVRHAPHVLQQKLRLDTHSST
eukprot:875745-Rhodomonas_salina.4